MEAIRLNTAHQETVGYRQTTQSLIKTAKRSSQTHKLSIFISVRFQFSTGKPNRTEPNQWWADDIERNIDEKIKSKCQQNVKMVLALANHRFHEGSRVAVSDEMELLGLEHSASWAYKNVGAVIFTEIISNYARYRIASPIPI